MNAQRTASLLVVAFTVIIEQLISALISELVRSWAGESAGTIAQWLVPILWGIVSQSWAEPLRQHLQKWSRSQRIR